MTDIRAMGRADLDEVNRRAKLWRERTTGKVEDDTRGARILGRAEQDLESHGQWRDVDLPFSQGAEEVSEGGAAT